MDFAHHLPVCVEHDGMKFWKQHSKTFVAICNLETNHLLAIIRNLVRRAKTDMAQATFEELLASAELTEEGVDNIPDLSKDLFFHSHYLLEPLLAEAEKRGYQCLG